MLELNGGLVRESDIGARKSLIENGHAEKLREGAPLAGIPRGRKYAAAAGKYCASHAASDGRKERQLALGKCDADDVALDVQVVNVIHVLSIRPQLVQCPV